MAQETSSEPLIPSPDLVERAAIFREMTGRSIKTVIGDCTDAATMFWLFADVRPDTVIHYAEQPSAPYSMMGYDAARHTLSNNLEATFNTIWSCLEHAPTATSSSWAPWASTARPTSTSRKAGSRLRTRAGKTAFYSRARRGRSITPPRSSIPISLVLRPPVSAARDRSDARPGLRHRHFRDGHGQAPLPNFHYDDIFGTVVNRFLVQAVAGVPLTVYGGGGQTRGYLNLNDTLQCIELAATTRQPMAKCGS